MRPSLTPQSLFISKLQLSRAMKAIKEDPAGSVARFNVPADVIDPLRGYLLLPLRDEGSVEAGGENKKRGERGA